MDSEQILLPKTDIMRESASEIGQICHVLQKFGINFFSHTRVYDDGSFIDMSNNAAMLDYFYYKTDVYKHYTPDVSPELIRNGYFLCSTIPDNKSIIACKEDLNIHNIVVLQERCGDHYQVWNFGSSPDHTNINHFYLNNIDILKSFIYLFKDKARLLIKRFEQDKIVRPKLEKDTLEEELTINREQFYKQIDIDRFFIDAKTYLTTREAECLYWLAKGKSANETAIILACSTRTIETHINHAKSKLNCYKQTCLVRAAFTLGIFHYFENKLDG